MLDQGQPTTEMSVKISIPDTISLDISEHTHVGHNCAKLPNEKHQDAAVLLCAVI